MLEDSQVQNIDVAVAIVMEGSYVYCLHVSSPARAVRPVPTYICWVLTAPRVWQPRPDLQEAFVFDQLQSSHCTFDSEKRHLSL